MRLINADKLYPDRMTKDGLAISQSQIANAKTVNAVVIPENATRREVFKSIFGIDVPRDIDLCEMFNSCEECPLKDQEVSCTVERDFNPWFDELYRKE